MRAKVITQLQSFHLAEKSFVYITYGSAEHDIFITKVDHDPYGDEIEFVGDNSLKIPVGAEFYIGKKNDRKIKMEVI
jgi:hypothetical protein